MIRITIITPCYNAEKTIEKTIRSVINQSYPDIEYIVVDGSSTDRTMDIINRYKDKIDCIISEPDNGIADAYNKGIRYATGDLIGIIAADDELLRDAVENVVKKYDGKSDVAAGNIITVCDEYCYIDFSQKNTELLRIGTTLRHPATFIRKTAYARFGDYSLEYKCAMDRELLLRFLVNGATFQIIDELVVMFNDGGISSANPCKYAFPEDRIITIKYGGNKIKAYCFWVYRSIMFWIDMAFYRLAKRIGKINLYLRLYKRDYMNREDVEKLRVK